MRARGEHVMSNPTRCRVSRECALSLCVLGGHGAVRLPSPSCFPFGTFFDQSMRKLWILFPIAFPAQIKKRICCVGFVFLRGESPVSLCCNLQPAVAFLHVVLGGDGRERLPVVGFAQCHRNCCSKVATCIKSLTTNK